MKHFLAATLLLLLAAVALPTLAHAPDAVVVEYYHPTLDHYFVTASKAEQALLDQGAFGAWQRTGAAFRAYLTAESGTQPVCRFYGLASAGLNSHFYSASPAECADVAQRFAGSWQLESSAVFYVKLPNTSTGACPSSTTPIYRLWNNRADSNHRYTISTTVRQQMVNAKWTAEGYGTIGVVMCAENAGVDLAAVPMGDGRISTAPKVGYVWSCQSQFNGGGAFTDGPWINRDGTWDRTAKLKVSGAVAWISSLITTLGNTIRSITGNGLPDHTTGTFPIASSDAVYAYDRNPNTIRGQTLSLNIPRDPVVAASASCLPMGSIGVLLTGSQIFNALDALGRDAGAHEVQDRCDGHPEMSGAYHYHTLTSCLKTADVPGQHSALVGYAKDGFGIYGNQGESGLPLTNADLDECHGHTHAIEWNGAATALYHYHATYEYPYTLGCYRGTAQR